MFSKTIFENPAGNAISAAIFNRKLQTSLKTLVLRHLLPFI
jgi:hypothetical protein